MWSRIAAIAMLAIAGAARADEPKTLSYNRDIRPILSDKCFACHGPDANHREADLRLDIESHAKDSAIVAGDPDSSPLVERILSEDEDERMPPPDSGKSLTPEEVALLKRWIDAGAPYEAYWAYARPKRPATPKVAKPDWSDQWIDRFVLAKLEAAGLEPSAEADRVTLLRRVYFDLIGLPPSPQAVAKFLDDKRDDAWEQVVDRLLASDRYGERMAMYWLDLVRYADTVGYHGDQDHNISPYRDYVIDAFNDDLPFDQFTREQLAGDLLPNPTVDQRIATGYNRLLQTSHEGGVQPKEYLAIYAADRVRNVSNVWMGATMGCCQCHDHKYDPYTLADFYAMSAFFADVDEAQHFKVGSNSLPTRRPPEIKVHSKRERQAIESYRRRIAELEKDPSETDKKTLANLKAELATLQKSIRTTMVTVAIKPRPIRVLPRGNWLDDSGPLVEPSPPEFLLRLLPNGAKPAEGKRLTRLDLANWLVDTKSGYGGLTARVMANRFWYLLFGVGVSKSLDDFGGQGEPPVHPELLDALAVEFYEHGWSVKHLVKQIVMSKAYRQSSLASKQQLEQDPENRLYGRQSRYRLPAEMVRDNALAISGLLNLKYGGGSVRPYQPAGYYRHLNFPKRTYKMDKNDGQWRRGVYVHWQRQFLHPTLRALDAPSREECTAQRPRSNTPIAAMALLNDPTFVEAARAFAARILRHEGSDDAKLDYAFRTAISRAPDAFERETVMEIIRQGRREYAENAEEANKLLGVGLSRQQTDKPQELAAWTLAARVLLNLSEIITRN